MTDFCRYTLTRPHAFVVMPFGTKPGADGKLINFNLIYEQYIAPALTNAGLEVFRADHELEAGNILADMFQELLIADLVIADLTINNPNVWYELGVRHGIRARGVILVCGGQVPAAFDLYTDRKLRYGLKDGAPDPDTLQADCEALTAMSTNTMQSWQGKKISPVYYHLPNLIEPDWKSLQIGEAKEFWERHDKWTDRINLARKEKLFGDLLTLADEAPIAALRSESWIIAGKALRRAGRYRFALEQLDRGLEVEQSLDGLREKGICLERLAFKREHGYSLERARQHYQFILSKYRDDSETWALLGRIDKVTWITAWRRTELSSEQMRREALADKGYLLAAIKNYYSGFKRDPSHYFSGINALTLMHLCKDLTNDKEFDYDIAMLTGAVRFAALNYKKPEDAFYAKATLGDLEVLAGTPISTADAYRKAIAINECDWFALDSCRQQLSLLKDLSFNIDNVNAGLAVFDRAIAKLDQPHQWEPRKVFLFSGHMVDKPNRSKPRFPNTEKHINIAYQAIVQSLTALGAGAEDLALTQGACGGDLLFTEACLALGTRVQWLQPFAEPDFIQRSVIHGGEFWRQRYRNLNTRVMQPIRAAPNALGPPPVHADSNYPYERCNRWLLYTALSYGIHKLNFICLWDGNEGDGRGGTKHMIDEVEGHAGNIEILSTKSMW